MAALELRDLGCKRCRGRGHQSGPGFPCEDSTGRGRDQGWGSGLGAGGLSRGCRLSLGRNDRGASVVWSSASRGHPAFQSWGKNSKEASRGSGGEAVLEHCNGLSSLRIKFQVLSVATCYLSDHLLPLRPSHSTAGSLPTQGLCLCCVLCLDAPPSLPLKPLLGKPSPASYVNLAPTSWPFLCLFSFFVFPSSTYRL